MRITEKFRIVPFILASVFLLNNLCIYVFAYSYLGIHRMVTQFDKPENQVTLVLDQNDWKSVQWIGGHDFVFQGKVYDVESVKRTGDHLQITCVNDDEETVICQNIKNKQENESPVQLSSIYKTIPVMQEADAVTYHIQLHTTEAVYGPHPVGDTRDAFTEYILPPRIG